MESLIRAAEAVLFEIKRLHPPVVCCDPDYCPTAAAINTLETELAKAKLSPTKPTT